jgi:toxin ParE1/3/4
VNRRYLIRPQADQDLDDQAAYYSDQESPTLGHRFLVAAHETFALLATQPQMGWHPRLVHPELPSARVFRIRGFEKTLIIYRPIENGIDILRVIHGSRNLRALLRREGLE